MAPGAKLERYAKRCIGGTDNVLVQMWDPIAGNLDTALANFRAAAPNMLIIHAKQGDFARGFQLLRAALCDPPPPGVLGTLPASTNIGEYSQQHGDRSANAVKLELKAAIAKDGTAAHQSISGDEVIYAEAMRLLAAQEAVFERYFGSRAAPS